MDYSEVPAPESLHAIVKSAWTLRTAGVPADRFRHIATPDGCLEIIRRGAGRSFWDGEQPSAFVAGPIRRPTELLFSGGASFVGLRIWPWAWNALSALTSPQLLDRWAALADAAPGLEAPRSIEEALALVDPERISAEARSLGAATLAARGPGSLAARSGCSARRLQRWFAREIGVPPRTYFRMLRFQDAFAGLATAQGSLALHAAEHGFADQAHMAREFRSMAGAPAKRARCGGRPPFL